MAERRALPRVLAVGYVLPVPAAALLAFRAPNDPSTWRTFLPELLTLPAILPLLPVVYVVGAATWSLSGADAGGPTWTVTVVYTLLFVGVAVADLWLAARLSSALALGRRRTRAPRQR